jgi:predicted nucleic acid-binding protein
MTIVVDASVAVRWLFQLDAAHAAENIIRPDESLIAPDLVLAEVTSAAWKLVTFENLPLESVAAVLRGAPTVFDEIVPGTLLFDRALAIAVELRHPVYDCFYLALAEQRDCQVATFDDRLVSRCSGTVFARRVKPLTARSGRRR